MANTEREAAQCSNGRCAPSQAATLWPFGAAPALAREIGERVRRLLDSEGVQALRLTSRAARALSDSCLQSVKLKSAAHIVDLAGAAPRLAALHELSVATHSAADVAALAAALPSLGRHCRITALKLRHGQLSGQLDLVAPRLPAALQQLTSLEATADIGFDDPPEHGSAAAEYHAAYAAAAAHMPLLGRLCVGFDDFGSMDAPRRCFDAALCLGAWPLLQVGWGGGGRAHGRQWFHCVDARVHGTLQHSCCSRRPAAATSVLCPAASPDDRS
jgi:hypothetical protein